MRTDSPEYRVRFFRPLIDPKIHELRRIAMETFNSPYRLGKKKGAQHDGEMTIVEGGELLFRDSSLERLTGRLAELAQAPTIAEALQEQSTHLRSGLYSTGSGQVMVVAKVPEEEQGWFFTERSALDSLNGRSNALDLYRTTPHVTLGVLPTDRFGAAITTPTPCTLGGLSVQIYTKGACGIDMVSRSHLLDIA